eukprot:m.46584 g.46584  ORF g.46584 m.46584 type:complete len:81 (+) comp12256_c0_seq2:1-243(+)
MLTTVSLMLLMCQIYFFFFSMIACRRKTKVHRPSPIAVDLPYPSISLIHDRLSFDLPYPSTFSAIASERYIIAHLTVTSE